MHDWGSWIRAAIGVFVAVALSWSTWVTLNVANYQSGEIRGERLTGTEAALMIEKDNILRRQEWTKLDEAMETRFNARIVMISDLVNTMVKQNTELIGVLKLQNELLQRDMPSRGERKHGD